MTFDKLLGVLSIVGALGSVGCGVDSDDYLVYRIALAASNPPIECYFPEETIPVDVAEDGDSYRQGVTMVVYLGFDDVVVLDALGLTLNGEETDDGFAFTGHDIDVSYVGVNQSEAKVTVTTSTKVTMNVDGAAVAGDIVTTATTHCDFLTATPADGLCDLPPNCVVTRAFSGVELQDVQVGSSIDS